MLSLDDIKQFFPESVHAHARDMIREYLQCKILEIIYKSKQASKLVFIGGTAIRIVYNSQRFSEDIDFDNKNLSLEDWDQLGGTLVRELSALGAKVEIRSRLNKTVFHHDLRFPGLIHDYGLSPYKTEKLMIKVDSENQGIEYEPMIFNLNKFDTNILISTIPLDIVFSMKLRAFFDRQMGRDLFDISSIAPKTKPNYQFLKSAIGISCPHELKSKVLKRCQELDLEALEHRTLPFLFSQDDVSRIRYFKTFMEQYEF